jgi:hypothetical protein
MAPGVVGVDVGHLAPKKPKKLVEPALRRPELSRCPEVPFPEGGRAVADGLQTIGERLLADGSPLSVLPGRL